MKLNQAFVVGAA